MKDTYNDRCYECTDYGKDEKQREHIGHWIFVHPLQENDPGAYICSECKTGDWDVDPAKDKVCKFCRAKMI